jgi:hypothetical protein
MLRNNYGELGSDAEHQHFRMEDNKDTTDHVMEFNSKFPEIDITNRGQMLEIQAYIVKVSEEDHEAGAELLKQLNAITSEQLQEVQDKEIEDFVDGIAKNLEGMTMDDIDKGISKGHSA